MKLDFFFFLIKKKNTCCCSNKPIYILMLWLKFDKWLLNGYLKVWLLDLENSCKLVQLFFYILWLSYCDVPVSCYPFCVCLCVCVLCLSFCRWSADCCMSGAQVSLSLYKNSLLISTGSLCPELGEVVCTLWLEMGLILILF